MSLIWTRRLERRQRTLTLFLGVLGVGGFAVGCDPTTPTVTSSGPFYTITSEFKNSATYAAGTGLTVPVLVKYNGSALGSASVRWALLSGHGHISDTLSTTDTLGATHIVWLLSSTPESSDLVVVAGDAADTLHVTGVVGAPSYLDRVGALSDTVSSGVAVTLGVVVRDHLGNAVPGATVNWTTSAGSLSTPSKVSDATGNVSAAFTATASGTYQVIAELPDRASLFFEIVVR